MIFRGDVLENIVSDTVPLLTGFIYEASFSFVHRITTPFYLSSAIMPSHNPDVQLMMDILFQQSIALFVLFGFHIFLVYHVVSFLWNHGLGKPLTRQCFPVIVTLMLIASTVLRVLELCHLSPPTILADEEILTLVFRIEECDITIRWLSILNYYLSDLIVLSRARSLRPGSQLVHGMLGIAMASTAVCAILNSILLIGEDLLGPMALGLDLCSPRLCSAGDLRALLFVPLVLTNVFAISLICHKAWVNRKVVQPFTDCNSNNKSRAAYTLASLRTSRNLALLIETGILYIGLMTVLIVSANCIFDGMAAESAFNNVWPHVITEISALYPTIIIIFVYSGATYHEGFPVNIQPNHSEQMKGKGTFNSIQSDMSGLATARKGIDDKHGREKEGLELVSV